MVAAVAQLTAISHPLASMPALRSPVTLSSSLSAGGPDGLGFADLFDKTLATRAAGAQSLAQLATQLTTSTPVDAGGGRTASITAAASFGSATDTLTIDMSATRQVHGASFSFNSSTPNLTLSGPAAADATLQFATHFVIHYDTTSQDAWLDASGGSPPLTITSTLGPANGATAGVGVLAVTIGSASLAVHQHLLATLGAPDAGGHIDLASGGYAPLPPPRLTPPPPTPQHHTP